MKRIINLTVGAMCLLTSSLIAQSTTFSIGELNPYVSEYIKPVALGMATGMGHGWSHRAQPHDTWGFDLSVSVVATAIPTSDQTFSISRLDDMTNDGYQFLSSDTDNPLSSSYMIPTAASPDVAGAYFSKDINPDPIEETLVEFNMLDGIMPEDLAYAPNFAVQLAFGLPKGTEFMLRLLPNVGPTITEMAGVEELTVDNFSLWGIGVKHDLKQWIPRLSNSTFWEISALLAYSEFNFDVSVEDFSLNPDELMGSSVMAHYTDINGDGSMPSSGTDFESLGFGMHMNALTGSIMIGADIPVIKPFIGLGFNKAFVSTGLTGQLPLVEYVDDDNVNVDFDPIGLNVEAGKTYMNFQAGLNIKILILNIYAQYSYQQYSMISAGVSLGIE